MSSEEEKELEINHYAVAATWYEDVDLTFEGVDIGDAMKYDVLMVTGRILKRAANDK